MIRRQLFYLICFWLLASPLFGQRLARLKKGNELYLAKNYTEAIVEYEALMSSATGQQLMGVDSRINLADCYIQTAKPAQAEKLYRALVGEAKERPEILLNFGESLVGIGKFDEAKAQFEEYGKLRPDDPRGAKMIKKCELIQAIRPVYYDVKLTPQEVANSAKNEEFGLTFYGTGLVFASNQTLKDMTASEREGISTVDMFYSEINPDKNLLAPRLLSRKLNTSSKQEGPATFTRDGKRIFFSQSAKATKQAPEGTLVLQLVTATNDNGKWSKTEVLPFNVPDLVFSHPCLSADGKTLYFASNLATGGQGGLDIWVSHQKDGRWTNPKNLGATINTPEDDGFPFLHPDGTLYFASKGHGNYGGYDLFRSFPVGNGVDWQKPENLGEPFNTAFDDTYFLLSDDQTYGYMASARSGSEDIYKFELEGADPKPIPESLNPRSAAIFNDSADIEGLVIEDRSKPTVVKAEGEDENFVDKMLQGGGTPAENPDNPNKEPKKGGTVAENPETPENPENPETPETPENPNVADSNPKTNPKTGKNPGKNTGKKPNKTVENPETPEIPENPETPEIPENPETPENPSVADSGSKTGKNTGKKPSKNDPKTNPKLAPQLVVEIKMVDADSKLPLDKTELVLRNAFTGKEEKLRVLSDGTVLCALKSEQKYEIIASCSGYYGGKLPITTMGANKDERVSAEFPLLKK